MFIQIGGFSKSHVVATVFFLHMLSHLFVSLKKEWVKKNETKTYKCFGLYTLAQLSRHSLYYKDVSPMSRFFSMKGSVPRKLNSLIQC